MFAIAYNRQQIDADAGVKSEPLQVRWSGTAAAISGANHGVTGSWPPLVCAVHFAFPEAVSLLLPRGASHDVGFHRGNWNHVLPFAVSRGHVGVVSLLLDAQTESSRIPPAHTMAALCKACEMNSLPMAEMLVCAMGVTDFAYGRPNIIVVSILLRLILLSTCFIEISSIVNFFIEICSIASIFH